MWMDRQSPEGKGLNSWHWRGTAAVRDMFKAETCRAQESQKRLTEPSSGCLGWESFPSQHREQQAPDMTASLKANNKQPLLCRINLWEMAEFLKQQGVINAINLDGGGSATLVLNGTLANYPSEHWWVLPGGPAAPVGVQSPAPRPGLAGRAQQRQVTGSAGEGSSRI